MPSDLVGLNRPNLIGGGMRFAINNGLIGQCRMRTETTWAIDPELDPIDAGLRRRRWRILREVIPGRTGSDLMPLWISTPTDFLGWLLVKLSANELQDYFQQLERLAKNYCDLELLRLARMYLRPDSSTGRTDKTGADQPDRR